jgi:hypothetical protein
VIFLGSCRNQSDRSGAAVEFRHGRELSFEEQTPVKDLETTFRTMLDGARTALNVGDAADSERRAKAVSALVRAERDVAEFLNEARATGLEDDEDACRQELQRRLSRFIEADEAGASLEVLARIAATGSAQ